MKSQLSYLTILHISNADNIEGCLWKPRMNNSKSIAKIPKFLLLSLCLLTGCSTLQCGGGPCVDHALVCTQCSAGYTATPDQTQCGSTSSVQFHCFQLIQLWYAQLFVLQLHNTKETSCHVFTHSINQSINQSINHYIYKATMSEMGFQVQEFISLRYEYLHRQATKQASERFHVTVGMCAVILA